MRPLKLALNRPDSPGDCIPWARHIASQLDGNPYFPSLPVPLATLRAHIDELEAAEAAVLSGTHGRAAERDQKLFVVTRDLEQDKTYCETVSNGRGEDRRAVAASSGFDTKRTAGQRKWGFEAEDGDRSGEVNLYAPRTDRTATYYWQLSRGGSSWNDLPSTNYASTVVSGLTPGVLYSFRHRTLVRDVLGDWSDVITFQAP
jgi:hypothetical protein